LANLLKKSKNMKADERVVEKWVRTGNEITENRDGLRGHDFVVRLSSQRCW
jgi:hypothetical protein